MHSFRIQNPCLKLKNTVCRQFLWADQMILVFLHVMALSCNPAQRLERFYTSVQFEKPTDNPDRSLLLREEFFRPRAFVGVKMSVAIQATLPAREGTAFT